jgi:hypothetical protein
VVVEIGIIGVEVVGVGVIGVVVEVGVLVEELSLFVVNDTPQQELVFICENICKIKLTVVVTRTVIEPGSIYMFLYEIII